MKIAITFNALPQGKRVEEVAEYDDISTIEAIEREIKALGHKTALIEAEADAMRKLMRERPDFVFNVAEGVGRGARESQIPMMLDMLGIPYTGSDALTLGITLDKQRTQEILSYHRVPTPRFQIFRTGEEKLARRMRFPLFVKPIGEGSSIGISKNSLVKNEKELRKVACGIISKHGQAAIAEKFIEGREFTVPLLGNPPKVLPLVEIDFSHLPTDAPRFDCYDVKWVYEDRTICPPEIDKRTLRRIEKITRKAFEVLGCRDICRMDVRVDDNGMPYIIDVNALPGLIPEPEEHSRFPASCYSLGMNYGDIIREILHCAFRRHGIDA